MATTGEQMLAMKEQAGLSLSKIAKAGGWKGASSVQKYFEPDYDAPLRPLVAERFAASLGPGVYEMSYEGPASSGGVSGIVALLRDQSIPADIRAAAAAEKLTQMMRGAHA